MMPKTRTNRTRTLPAIPGGAVVLFPATFETAPGMSEASFAALSSPSLRPLRTRTHTPGTGAQGPVIVSIPIMAAPIESKSWTGSSRANARNGLYSGRTAKSLNWKHAPHK